jgi:hypothetical protein
MKNEFTELLFNFFTEADKVVSKYTPPTKFHESYIKNGDRWEKTIKEINDWNYFKIKNEIFKPILSIKEIESCIKMLEIIFEPNTYSRADANDKRPFTKKETKEANRNTYSYELAKLFFRFKEMKETDSNVSLESFSIAMADFAFSNEIVSYFKAYLIGFRTKDINEVDFVTFKIQKLSEDEKLEMINKYEGFFNNLTPLNIVHGFDDAWIYEHWITGKIKTKIGGKRRTFFHVYTDDSFIDIEKELIKILVILRIGSGIDLGIRSFYAKSGYPNDCPIYDTWFSQKYKFANYAVTERSEIGGNRRQFNLSVNEDFSKKHAESVKDFLRIYEKYESQRLKLVDQAIEYYTNAFEQNFAIYSFTSLMMAFESLLNGKEKKIEFSKEERLNLLNRVSENIIKLTSPNKIKKEWSKLNPVNGITKAISIGGKIYSEETGTQKEFNHFFNPENGCYKLRNDLLHGNFNNEIEEKIVQILPQLSCYVRSLILRIIELRINGKLICDEANYYEKLENFAS